MITCPNCNHKNPEGSVQCENCYTALPSTYSCPNCGASVQTNASFCGQCGFSLQTKATPTIADNPFAVDRDEYDYSLEEDSIPTTPANNEFEKSPWDIEEDVASSFRENEAIEAFSYEESLQSETIEEIEELPENDVLYSSFGDDEAIEALSYEESLQSETTEEIEELPENDVLYSSFGDDEAIEALSYEESLQSETTEEIEELPEDDVLDETEDIESWISSVREESILEDDETEDSDLALLELEEIETNPQYAILEAEATNIESSESETIEFVVANSAKAAISTTENIDSFSTVVDKTTEIQKRSAVLFHMQTGTQISIPFEAKIIRIGKPNSQAAPDIDISDFPNSQIVSRIHADIKVIENDYYIEDRGSSNGTYVNHSPLIVGKSLCLKNGDRICLGKGDLVTFIFRLD